MNFINEISPKRIYIIAVTTLIFLIVSNQLLIQRILEEKKDDATVINLAGRQRMLSQKIAKNVFLSENNEIKVEVLKEDVKTWSLVHRSLQNGDAGRGIRPNDNEYLESLFLEIEPHFEAIQNSLSSIKSQNEVIASIPILQRHELAFLDKMDKIVGTFEAISNKAVNKLIWIEIGLGLFSLMILGSEIYLVFKVFLGQIKAKNEELEENIKQLSSSKGKLFEYIQRFDLSLQAIDAGIWDWYIGDNTEWWSPRFYEMLGYEVGEIEASYNTFLNGLVHPEDKAQVVKAVEEHLASKTHYKIEIRMKLKSGEYQWFETVGQASFDQDEKPIRMVGSIININERKEIQSELIEAEHILEVSEKIGGVISWVFDFENRQEIYGQTLVDFYGFNSRPERLTEAILNIVHADDIEKVKKAFAQASKKTKPWKIEYRINDPSGAIKYVLVIVSEIKMDSNNKILKIIGTTQNVTESRKTEDELSRKKEELEESLEVLREIQEVAKIGTWEVDLTTMVVDWSDEVYRIHEIELGTILKVEEGINFYREDYQDTIQSVIDKAIANNESWDVECVLVTTKGKEIWVRAIGYPVFVEQQLFRLRGLFMDIDQNKRKSLLLDEANEKLQLSVEAGQIAIWIWNIKTNELDWNDKAYEVFGVEKSVTPTFEYFVEMIHPSDQEYVMAATTTTIETGDRFDIVFRFNRPDGKKVILSGRGDVVRDSKGIPVQMIGINLDVTERMRLQENIKMKESQLRTFVEQAPASVAMLDREMKYITMSNQWFEQYSLEKKDIIGMSHYDIFPEIKEMPEWLEQHQRVLNGEELSNPKDKIVKLDGTVQWISWKLIPWYDEPGEIGGIIMFTADITSEVFYTEKLEKEVSKRTKELASVNEELESFSYSVSHDLRAPLRSINGFSDMLIEDYKDKIDENGVRLLNVVKNSAVKMGKLIDDILEFSRLGKKSIQFGLVNMELIFSTVISELNLEYVGKEIDIEIGELYNISGDTSLMKQVVVNLMSNAYKYSANEDKITVIVGSEIQGEYIKYSIKDSGVGFDMKYHDKLFGVFQRLHADSEFEGTGVGLAIVRRIISKHEGSIWAESEIGKGSTFYFTVPK